MIKRIAASEARLSAQAAALKAAEILEQSEAQRKIAVKLWNLQKRRIICAAVDGEEFVNLSNSLAMGRELESAGFKITETHTSLSDEEIRRLVKSDKLLEVVLDANIEYFLSASKHNFTDEVGYERYIRSKFTEFLKRADRVRDTGNEYALLNFLNSVGYRDLGCDGGWNEFSSELISINKIMHIIVNGIPKDSSQRLKLIHEFMPLTVIDKSNIYDDLIVCKKSHGYFSVAWSSKIGQEINSESILTRRKIMWLAGKQGQELMNFLFRQINKSVKMGLQSMELSYSSDENMWKFDGYSKIESITLDQFIEVLTAKGYKAKNDFFDQGKVTVNW